MLRGRFALLTEPGFTARANQAPSHGQAMLVASTHQLLLFAITHDSDGGVDFCLVEAVPWANFVRLVFGAGWTSLGLACRESAFTVLAARRNAAETFVAALSNIGPCARKPMVLTDVAVVHAYAVLASPEPADDETGSNNTAGHGSASTSAASSAVNSSTIAAAMAATRTTAHVLDLGDLPAARQRASALEGELGLRYLAVLRGRHAPPPPDTASTPIAHRSTVDKTGVSVGAAAANALGDALVTVTVAVMAQQLLVCRQVCVVGRQEPLVELLWSAPVDSLTGLRFSLSSPAALILNWDADEDEDSNGESESEGEDSGAESGAPSSTVSSAASGKTNARLTTTLEIEDPRDVPALAVALNASFAHRYVCNAACCGF